MQSVTEAQKIIRQQTCALPVEVSALGPNILGCVLAEEVPSDRDSPPYDKAMMDGYALRLADLSAGKGRLSVIEEITAGRIPQRTLAAGQAARIMTGAPVPAGADAVVMIERTRDDGADTVLVDDPSLQAGKNILLRGREMRQGETILQPGAMLRPTELGLLAALGRTHARLIPAPRVAVLCTGDELVDAAQTPGPGQIRNSNGPMLMAQVCRAGARANYLGIAPDVQESLAAAVAEGLKCDVLVLSGGVSAGKLDLVPGVLESAGVVPHFHKVAMKPGKPVFFGTRRRDPAPPTLVFGLPGNPVSSLVCFELFVRPALQHLGGHADAGPRVVCATLEADLQHQSDRPTYHPARVSEGPEGRIVQARPWFGSPDLRSVAAANAFLVLPVGQQHYHAGERMSVLLTDDRTG